MLGTWRTNDAEKNHTHKIGKRKKGKRKKKKRKKEKRNPTMDRMDVENGMAFCVGRETHEGRKELRYDTRGSGSESEWHE